MFGVSTKKMANEFLAGKTRTKKTEFGLFLTEQTCGIDGNFGERSKLLNVLKINC